MKGDKIKCPVCEGIGELDAPALDKDIIGKKKRAAGLLKEAGFSFREIMRFLGYKSPRSVQYLLENREEPPETEPTQETP